MESSSRRERLLGGGPGNTLESDEDRLKLDELMALCTTLQNRVLDLDFGETKTLTQIMELVYLTARVESSNNEASLGEDAFKKGRIDAIDADEEITLNKKLLLIRKMMKLMLLKMLVLLDKGKGILIEPVKPMKKKDLIRLDEEAALKLQAEFDEEERLAREKAKKEK
ncbi:hypothetical protein Tco_1404655 [Tanacetum coccineum]